MVDNKEFEQLKKVARQVSEQLKKDNMSPPEIGLLGALLVLENRNSYWRLLELSKESVSILGMVEEFLTQFPGSIKGIKRTDGSEIIVITSSWEICVKPIQEETFICLNTKSWEWIKTIEDDGQFTYTKIKEIARRFSKNDIDSLQGIYYKSGLNILRSANLIEVEIDDFDIWSIPVNDEMINEYIIRLCYTNPEWIKSRENEIENLSDKDGDKIRKLWYSPAEPPLKSDEVYKREHPELKICGNCGNLYIHHIFEDEVYCYQETNGDIFTREPNNEILMDFIENENPDMYKKCLDLWYSRGISSNTLNKEFFNLLNPNT